MKGKVGKSTAVISDLPESVLHHILSYLPMKDSIATSLLSKQWSSAWKSNPFLSFDGETYLDYTEFPSLHFKEPRKEFLNFVDRSLQHLHQNKLSIERMRLSVSSIDEDFVPLIDTWLPLALHNGVLDLHFRVFNSHSVYPLPESTFTFNSSLLRSSFKFFRLEKLTLYLVYLSENMVRDIIGNCPNIGHLFLDDICGLENLNISKLDKLVSLRVFSIDYREIKSFYVNAISLKKVSFGLSGERFDLNSCCNLREIKLCGSDITDAQFHQHISKFPLLEVLEIRGCQGLQSIKISLQRLKLLRMFFCYGVKAIEIEAPSLSSYELTVGSQDSLISVLSKDIRCSMYLYHGIPFMHTSWSLKLIKYLGVLLERVNFHQNGSSIKFTSDPDVSIEAVNCVDLTGLKIGSSFHWVALLDALLSSCHPNIVSMTVDSSDEDNCVNVFCKMLVQSECQLCCNSPHCKCWRSQLKGATIKSFNKKKLSRKNKGEIDHKLFLRVLNASLSIPVDSKVKFRLNWGQPEHESFKIFSVKKFSISSN